MCKYQDGSYRLFAQGLVLETVEEGALPLFVLIFRIFSSFLEEEGSEILLVSCVSHLNRKVCL